MIKLFAPLLVALVSWASTPLVLAQDYPNKALRLVVAYPPGASSDTLARSVAQKMSQSIGQPIVVENRAGASGNIGTEYVARQSGDGYTFMLGTDATHAANMHLTATPSFHPLKDFTALTLAALNPIVLVVNPAVPVRSVRELIDYGRANPDKIAYGSSGAGSPHHLAGELGLQRGQPGPGLHQRREPRPARQPRSGIRCRDRPRPRMDRGHAKPRWRLRRPACPRRSPGA